jgi:hypothetical protein
MGFVNPFLYSTAAANATALYDVITGDNCDTDPPNVDANDNERTCNSTYGYLATVRIATSYHSISLARDILRLTTAMIIAVVAMLSVVLQYLYAERLGPCHRPRDTQLSSAGASCNGYGLARDALASLLTIRRMYAITAHQLIHSSSLRWSLRLGI